MRAMAKRPVAAAAVLISRGTLASIPTFDTLLLNRMAVLGVLLFSLALGGRISELGNRVPADRRQACWV